jgi:serine/threonine-protein kinase
MLEDKYQIVSRLGAGGMGSVYRARRLRIGDEVAVKVLLEDFVKNATAIERFRREARAAARLHHPNVVTIHDYGEANESDAPAYIVMELVAGTSLRNILEREKRLSAQRAVSLIRSVCAGVAAAHRNHIVHRDIKPDNIIVQPPHSEGEEETVKVLDFGIAKLRDLADTATLTQTGIVVGTPYYMSPEQCKAEPLDSRSDVYSLGAMMYEMLAGRPPFEAETATGIVAKHLTQTPPPLPPEVGVPAALEEVIMRALSKDPKERQEDAGEFARECLAAMAAQTAARGAPATRQASASEVFPPAVDRREASLHSPAPPTAGQKPSRAGAIAIVAIVFVVAAAGAAFVLWKINSPAPEPNENVSIASANTNSAEPARSPQTSISPGPQERPSITPIPQAAGNTNSTANANQSASTNEPDLPTPGVGAAGMASAETKILAGERLAPSDIKGLSRLELRLLRNTAYARHGRVFDRPEMRRYFSSKSWYRPRGDYRDSELTAVDKANINLILEAEKNGG